jgi:DNA polymerase III delta prime subunit
MKLPTEKTKPSEDPMAYSILLYGPTKVGKTTFASHAENALFLATEPGLNALAVFSVGITNWAEMLSACAEVAGGKHDFKTIVVDTVDNAYSFCADHVCKENGWSHPSEGAYGRGFAAVNNEFRRVLLKLAQLPYGLLLISHSQEKEIETKTGKYSRITTTLPEGARKIVIGLMDLVLLCEVSAVRGETGEYSYKRIIKTKPTPEYDAGDRTGRLPEEIPLDYDEFAKSFAKATKATKGKK